MHRAIVKRKTRDAEAAIAAGLKEILGDGETPGGLDRIEAKLGRLERIEAKMARLLELVDRLMAEVEAARKRK